MRIEDQPAAGGRHGHLLVPRQGLAHAHLVVVVGDPVPRLAAVARAENRLVSVAALALGLRTADEQDFLWISRIDSQPALLESVRGWWGDVFPTVGVEPCQPGFVADEERTIRPTYHVANGFRMSRQRVEIGKLCKPVAAIGAPINTADRVGQQSFGRLVGPGFVRRSFCVQACIDSGRAAVDFPARVNRDATHAGIEGIGLLSLG